MDERLRFRSDGKLLEKDAAGDFVPQKQNFRLTWPLRVAIAAAALAVICTGLAAATLLLWVLSLLVPVALAAAIIAYAAFRIQVWRNRRIK